MSETDQSILLQDVDQIVTLFNRMTTEHSAVNIYLDAEDKPIEARVFGLHHDDRMLSLTTLQPIGRLRHSLCADDLVDIQGVCRGIEFRIDRTRVSYSDELELLVLQVPQQMHYLQRRVCFRITLPISEQKTTRIAGSTLASPLTGKLMDISFEGARLCFDGLEQNPLAQASGLVDMDASISADEALLVRAAIRHQQFDQALGTLSLGVEFSQVTPAQDDVIHRFVLEQQRKQLRRKAMLND